MYLAYVYRLTHKINGHFYIGYRCRNIKLKLLPEDDLGVVYFTSSKYINKTNFSEYHAEILFKSTSSNEAYDFENKLIQESWNNPLLLNRSFQQNGNLRFKITEDGSNKLSKLNKNKKWYNNGVKEIYSHYKPDNFEEGRLKNPFPKNKGWTKNYNWYNNGNKEILLEKDKVPPFGFIKGKLPATEDTNKKISITMKQIAPAKGKKWYTNGKQSVLTHKCPHGWNPGHSHGSGNSHLNRDYSGYHWYTDGKNTIRARECPEGFSLGRKVKF
jgi:hypothetical protein